MRQYANIYGVPVCFHKDQGATLNGQVILSLCKYLGINQKHYSSLKFTGGKVQPHAGVSVIKDVERTGILTCPKCYLLTTLLTMTTLGTLAIMLTLIIPTL